MHEQLPFATRIEYLPWEEWSKEKKKKKGVEAEGEMRQ